MVQRNGGSPKTSLKAGRTFEGAENIEVILPKERQKKVKNGYGISNHSIMHNVIDIWKEYIEPNIEK